MSTTFVVNVATTLPDGTAMVRGTVVDGPRVTVGQRGASTSSGTGLVADVVGVGVVDPNLDETGRQGVLLKLIEGDAGALNGATLCFAEVGAPTPDSPPSTPRG